MFYLMARFFLFILMGLTGAGRGHSNPQPKTEATTDTLVSLANQQVVLTFSLHGGALVDFHFRNQRLNPFSWKVAPGEMPPNNRNGAPFQGHFICIGRWGSPSPGEIRCGIPHNGEPANRWWQAPSRENGLQLKMQVEAPLEQLALSRVVTLSGDQPWFVMKETLTNLQKTGRLMVMVQHATFGAPFLDETVIVNSNASLGFNQALVTIDPQKYTYHWPIGLADTLGTPIDLRRSDWPGSYVTTHIIESEYGWATAANPSKNLLIGYIWKTSDYPWLHVWHGIKDGRLWAKGIEFGTTGLGDTFNPEDRIRHTFHGVDHIEYLDAMASVSKTYLCFLIKIPADFQEIKSVRLNEGQLQIDYASPTNFYSATLTVGSF